MLPFNHFQLSFRYRWTTDVALRSWLACRMSSVCKAVVLFLQHIQYICASLGALSCIYYTALLLSEGFFPLGWTSSCFSVLLSLNCTRKPIFFPARQPLCLPVCLQDWGPHNNSSGQSQRLHFKVRVLLYSYITQLVLAGVDDYHESFYYREKNLQFQCVSRYAVVTSHSHQLYKCFHKSICVVGRNILWSHQSFLTIPSPSVSAINGVCLWCLRTLFLKK